MDLRRRLEGMLPRVDLPDLILEVMAWHPAFVHAFTGLSGGRSRLAELHVTIAAALTAHALNVGYVPVISEGVPTLTRGRISHVDQNYAGGEHIDGRRALEMGLIQELVPADELLAAADAWCDRVAALPPHAAEMVKPLLRGAADGTWDGALALEEFAEPLCFTTEPFAAAIETVLK